MYKRQAPIGESIGESIIRAWIWRGFEREFGRDIRGIPERDSEGEIGTSIRSTL